MPAAIPKEKVLEDIQRVGEIVDAIPTLSDYQEYGNYADVTAMNKFGSWVAAREAAGFNGGPTGNNVSKETVISELQRVADELGHAPSQNEFNEYANVTHQVAYDRFGSFNKAKEAAGLETRRDEKLSQEELANDIRRVGEIVESVPSQTDYHQHGNYGYASINRNFERWSVAVRKAGFEPRTVGPPTGKENPAWRGGYEPYYGPNWYEQRLKARERDKYQCQSCGLTDSEHKEKYDCELEMHHIVAARTFDDYEEMNRLDNLVTLCSGCHQRYEHLPNKAAKELIEGE